MEFALISYFGYFGVDMLAQCFLIKTVMSANFVAESTFTTIDIAFNGHGSISEKL
jgi:hypothetical protein